MSTFVEIHALQSVPPSNMNRDDTGSPKTALYGGVTRARVSSQSWKRAMREHFNSSVDASMVGTRSTSIAGAIASLIKEQRPELEEERSLELAVSVMEAAGFKKPVPKDRKRNTGVPETGYLLFLSQRQIEALATAAVEHADADNPGAAMKAAKVKALVDAEHSVDIALFGRMVADSADLNVDAACQVAHALSVHEATPEYDFFTAVDDLKSRNEEQEDAGAGMMGTVGFVSPTLYRYAAVDMDQLRKNLGDDQAVRLALAALLRSFVEAMPTGKQATFANGTRPAAVMITVGTGQPASLVGAFENPVRGENGHLDPAVQRLATHAREVFDTWRRPQQVHVVGLPSQVEPLRELGMVSPFDEAIDAVVNAAVEAQ